MPLSTALCWNSAHYEFAESEMGCTHGRWIAHMSRFLDATAAFTRFMGQAGSHSEQFFSGEK